MSFGSHVAVGAVSALVSAVSVLVTSDKVPRTTSWTERGTCAKEFGPEARARGHTHIPAGGFPKGQVVLTADLPAKTCTAKLPDGKGGTSTFTWTANKGTHIPDPVTLPLASGAASAPAPGK
jgi:hypothetical protein